MIHDINYTSIMGKRKYCVRERTIKKLNLTWRNFHLVTSVHLSHCLSRVFRTFGKFDFFSTSYQMRWSFSDSIRQTKKLLEEKTMKDFSCRGFTKNVAVLRSAFCWYLLQFTFFIEFLSKFVYYCSAMFLNERR